MKWLKNGFSLLLFTGKTAAFTLGLLNRITVDTPPTLQAILLTPTRELAQQIVAQAVIPLAAHMPGLQVEVGIAGSAVRGPIHAHLVVGTPGKVVDWLKRKQLNTRTCQTYVLDEADTMVGTHRANSLLVHQRLPPTCQRLLFSATFSTETLDFCAKLTRHNCPRVLLNADATTNATDIPTGLCLDIIKQLWIDTREYKDGSPVEFLADIYALLTIGQSIVFVATKKEADQVHTTLETAGYTCSVLHSGVEAADRDQTMEDFRQGASNVLITTNVLARGVDVDNVCLVINFSVPTVDSQPDFETYLHRIGRTGRFGRKGTAITFCTDAASMQALAAIEQHFTNKNGQELIQKASADPEALAEAIEI